MAAGKRLKLKLKNGSRVRLTEAATGAETGTGTGMGMRTSDSVIVMASASAPASAPASASNPPLRSQHANANAPEILPSPSQPPLLDQKTTGPLSSQPNMSPLAPALSSRRRRSSVKSAAPTTIKRSASTPNVRVPVAADAGMSLAEKRRNKLGYQRISIACVHCRRRKIRCLRASDDPEGRCSNCIRLKKECNFYTIDQQPPAERRPRKESKADRGSTEASTSSSSSPPVGGGHIIDQVDQFNHYTPISLSDQEYPGSTAPLSVSTISPASRAPINFGGYEFPPHNDRGQHLESPFFDHSPMSAGAGHPPLDDPSSAFWESPMTPAFSPRFSGAPQLPVQYHREVGGAFTPFNGLRQDPGWPQRSASFGQIEDLQNNYQNVYQAPSHFDYRRRPTYMPAPSLQNSGNSSNTSMTEAPPAPVSAPLGNQAINQLGFTDWTALPSPAVLGHSPMNKAPEYGGWTSDTGQLAKVQEEEGGTHFGGDSTVMYSSAGHR
ncbi:c6 finger domain protein [Lasallia pustulata]|uniref:C6 finger domain protein n=1 Tax=Lasallia pustulata TaxID=136370 RepID=A0A1W5DBV0_9LECA|nr:c6 finger domain protein [Lasallia pustulata]